MSGRRSRVKGHDFERLIARDLRDQLGIEARRGLQYRDGAECPDVVGLPGYWVECKRGKRVSIGAAMRQASEACDRDGAGLCPLVISKEDGEAILATLPFGALIELLRESMCRCWSTTKKES